MRGAFIFLTFAACAHPEYSDTPFLCGEGGECPSGYSCMQNLCVRDGVQLPQADAAPQGPDAGTQSMPDAPSSMPDAARPDAPRADAAIADASTLDGPRPDAQTPDAAGGGACTTSSQCATGCCEWTTGLCVVPSASSYCTCSANSECTQSNQCCDRDFGFCTDRSIAICL
jgi:hypothetical protein